jgi:hypothetical protein
MQDPGDTKIDNPGLWVLDTKRCLKRFSNFCRKASEGDEVAIYEKRRGTVALGVIVKKYPRGRQEGPSDGKYWRRFGDIRIIGKKGLVSLSKTYQILSGNKPKSNSAMGGFLQGNYTAGVGEIKKGAYKKLSSNFADYKRLTELVELEEGDKYKSEREFRRRNAFLIALKKSNSDYRCEICNTLYEENYGNIGHEFIIAHHLKPIGARAKSSLTRLQDIALVCSNCHDMLHKSVPPIDIAKLREIIKSEEAKRKT